MSKYLLVELPDETEDEKLVAAVKSVEEQILSAAGVVMALGPRHEAFEPKSVLMGTRILSLRILDSPPGSSYHDVHVTTDEIPRARLFDLPYGVELMCNRVSGWELWSIPDGDRKKAKLLGGEYAHPHEWLMIDVAGLVILDSRRRKEETDATDSS